MRELPIVCPAGAPVHPPADSPSVLCGVLNLANDGAEVRGFQSRGHVSPVMSGDRDTNAVFAYCRSEPHGIAGYDQCPIWRAARDAELARRRGPNALRDDHAGHVPTIDPELREAVALSHGIPIGV